MLIDALFAFGPVPALAANEARAPKTEMDEEVDGSEAAPADAAAFAALLSPQTLQTPGAVKAGLNGASAQPNIDAKSLQPATLLASSTLALAGAPAAEIAGDTSAPESQPKSVAALLQAAPSSVPAPPPAKQGSPSAATLDQSEKQIEGPIASDAKRSPAPGITKSSDVSDAKPSNGGAQNAAQTPSAAPSPTASLSAPSADTAFATSGFSQTPTAVGDPTRAAAPSPAKPNPMERPPAAQQAAHQIIRRFDGANASIEVRLDPPELGRVDVRLDVSRDQTVQAIIHADNPQTLTDLARAARELERALSDAGLMLAENGLHFDLRSDQRAHQEGEPSEHATAQSADDAEITSPRASSPFGLESWRRAGVNIWV